MKNLSLLVFLMICFFADAQKSATIAPCGTTEGRSEWLKQYQANPALFQRNTDTLLSVPMTVHIVGNDQGSGYFSTESLLDAFCTLNEDMAPANIQFFMAGDIVYHDNSAYYVHSTVLEGAAMMFANNVPNTLNTYFVSDPAGSCGYNLPYAGIAMRKSCSDPQDHTWAHEVGHAFSLPHPFLGWEGGVSYDGSVAHNYNDPAPTEVYYDYTYFQDTLIEDTLIIDTALVELVDGSNCAIAADGFCDTAPDYLNYRWECNANTESTVTQTDPTGAQFVSDASLIMSYALDNCANRFSDEQIAAMRANLYDEKPELISEEEPGPFLENTVTANLIFPSDEVVQFDFAEFEWEALEGATNYILEVSRLASFPSGITEVAVTSTNNAVLTNLLDDKTYYWRVRAFNAYSFCTEFSDYEIFQTGEVSNIPVIEEVNSLHVFPNILESPGIFTINLQSTETMEIRLSLHDAAGQLLKSKQLQINSGQNRMTYSIEDLPAGLYLLQLSTGKGSLFEKIMIQ